MKIEIYSDIACPWCYIGKRRFERALGAFNQPVEVVYRPYQLVPDAPEQAVPHRAWLDQRYGPQSRAMDDRVAALGAADGITYDFDAALETNTFDGHRLLWLAATEYGLPVQHTLKEKLLAAHFTDGVDVGDHAALIDVAVAAGLDRARVTAFLASGEGSGEVRAELDHAHAIGVSSVPTFVIDEKWAVQGAQETSTFLRALEQAAASASEGVSEEAAGSCDDGSCAV
ncbi:DsbA family oxidoreductase [Streptacidiphilus carbonis]|jgi:predicted DsbA family dithiol-disulfide isomerase|uniref:DsbA family oxidoreductase n=1 Tax=Streptacidiphilus carbonis TaxID=105422 RepID=UPI0005A64339|nr:DsbA family oxidoreductase [Streptacidiphilus carbonis]